MDFTIKNNSDGKTAGVTKENQLEVEAEIHELQHHIAFKKENAYQVIGKGVIASGSNTILHIKNTDSTRKMVISFVRTQLVTTSVATLPETGTYFEMGYNQTVASGGVVVTPVNTDSGSGKVASVVATQLPTIAGTIVPLDDYYFTAAGGIQTYNKQGSLILGLDESITFNVQTTAAGYAYVRATFMMIENP